ncbi:MAG: hypothetical protein WDA02_07965 [Saccharofermentanales bacterium]
MSWRNEVRKQINRSKSKRWETKVNKRIIESNRRELEKERDEINSLGKSLYYPSDENDDSYCY